MWWDGVWAGRRLDSGVCPIYKHTDLDITCGVNKIKVLPKGVLLKLFKLINYMNSPTIVLTLFLLHAFSGDAQIFLTFMLCKQSDQHDYHPRYRAPGTFRLTGTSDPTPPARVPNDQILLRAPRRNNMYMLDMSTATPLSNISCFVSKASLDESSLWHRRLCHVGSHIAWWSLMKEYVPASQSITIDSSKSTKEEDLCVELSIASRQILAESTSAHNDVSQSETVNTSHVVPLSDSTSVPLSQEESGSPSAETNTLETLPPKENPPTTVQSQKPQDLPEIQLEVVLPNLESSNLELTSHLDVIPRTRIHNTHPVENIIGNVEEGVRTRSSMHEANIYLFSCFLSQIEPKKVAETLKDSSWIEAIQEELLQFERQGVWKICPLPKGKYAIGAKWVFRNKKDDKVARIEAIRIFLAFAAAKNFKVFQMDVKSAFLYGRIDEEVYVCQPPGFEDPKFPDHVCKLDKALYGLHQAPRKWYETLSSFLLANNFKRGTIDKTLFFKKSNQHIMLVQIYVDDIIFGSTNESLYKDMNH
ncbi:hypothetical protein E3N88_07395 [Mikania micrantha]|uniref:Reverse transcriptase Ty1/copia-type domain-containing protein n=1 Tax=Mikania micrantha TaxID=192012 RepID=A0A5N6PUA6_9ASTR|nr:hypothetical protein E3N88_07395 [Mikania micrantha]